MLKYKFDGAFGTLYADLGGREAVCEEANLSEPQLVRSIHKAYIEAGANAVKTNTYGANLITFPDAEKLKEILSAGWSLASDLGACVFADIGNIRSDPKSASAAYLKNAEIFCSLGSRNFLFETLDDLEPIRPAVDYIRDNTEDSVIIVSFAAGEDGYTSAGRNYKRLICDALKFADYSGLNCVCGPTAMKGLLSDFIVSHPETDPSKLSAMPNAGYPSRQSGTLTFSNDPAYFAERFGALAGLGIGILGGCCGTTPEHMQAAYSAAIGSECRMVGKGVSNSAENENFFRTYDYSKKFVAVELNPPVDLDDGFFMEAARRFVNAGVDALTITDSPLSRVRADALALSGRLSRELSIPVIPHLTCRDRNRIAVKGGLLAAGLDGVEGVLAITGDSVGEELRERGCKGVYNLNSYGLISYIASLNGDVFAKKPYCIAAALNVNALNFSSELKRAEKKLELGADIFMTQAIFTEESIENLRTAREKLNCRILAGVMPPAGYKNALFLSGEVGGITIPESLIEAFRCASAEEAAEISLNFTKNIIDRTWDICDGFYVMFPLKKVGLAEELTSYIKTKAASCYDLPGKDIK